MSAPKNPKSELYFAMDAKDLKSGFLSWKRWLLGSATKMETPKSCQLEAIFSMEIFLCLVPIAFVLSNVPCVFFAPFSLKNFRLEYMVVYRIYFVVSFGPWALLLFDAFLWIFYVHVFCLCI